MKVLFDHQIFESQRFGGVSKYFVKLFHNFKKLKEVDHELAITYSDNWYLGEVPGVEYLPLPVRPLSYNNNASNKYSIGQRYFERYFYLNRVAKCHQKNIAHSINMIQKQDYDVFHPTYYDEYFLSHIKDKPYVLTVHDLTHQIYPEFFSPSWIDKSVEIIHRANRIIAVSENTKKDLVEFYEVEPDKIDVIHLASSILKVNSVESLAESRMAFRKYLLFIGSRETYKNFYFLIRALSTLLEKDKELVLLCTGDAFTEEEIVYFTKMGIVNSIKHIHATEEELPSLYSNSIAFIYPSLYEGFGMPILEAFACGCPVICSQSSSFPEIAGNAALYFEPKNKQSIYDSIYKVLNDDVLRKKMIIDGYTQLEKFSWLKTVTQTKEVYLKAMR